MRVLAIVFGLALLVPLVAAEAPPYRGTERQPELVDASDDVRYDPLYTGSKDHKYIDTLAAWFEYDAALDAVDVDLKMTDSSRLLSAPSDLQVFCDLEGNLTDGRDVVAHLTIGWNKFGQSANVTHHSFYQDSKGNEGLQYDLHSIDSSFEMRLEEPGYFVWHVNRVQLQGAGVELIDPSTHCGERQAIAGITKTATNMDEGASDGSFELEGLHPVSSEPSEDMFSAGTPAPTTSVVTRSSALGAACVALLLLGAAVWRRRQT
jgi:hypothetical protein